MLEIKIDEHEVKQILEDKIHEAVKRAEKETVFWDFKELIRQTRMSRNTIIEQFFYETEFPKFKIGTKWYFPAKETREFLLKWLKEAPIKK
ncbi:group-specific protein [Bacillus sp. B-jedd]|uniref:group-specific protein n=1 Tax=Bacillus sp. B-jedd TaxID=1476857 RepID=UPI0005155F7D|nr:group-specific protein [Bacillus sp. B-jedd]CEG28064.1 group-specific protein [Bacillus sp. B-jedd]